jgi:hypothetical protein
MKKRKLLFVLSFISVSLLFIPPSHAVVIDFESFNLGGSTYLDVTSPLVFSNVGGSGVNVTINEGADLRIYDLYQYGGWLNGGQALIDMFWSNYSNPSGTTILFSQPISGFSLNAGDFGSDDDSPLSITAYNSSNAVIDSDSAIWLISATPPPLALLNVSGSGITKIIYQSGGSYTGSTFIDNLTFTPETTVPTIPETTTMLLLVFGLMGLAGVSRRFQK